MDFSSSRLMREVFVSQYSATFFIEKQSMVNKVRHLVDTSQIYLFCWWVLNQNDVNPYTFVLSFNSKLYLARTKGGRRREHISSDSMAAHTSLQNMTTMDHFTPKCHYTLKNFNVDCSGYLNKVKWNAMRDCPWSCNAESRAASEGFWTSCENILHSD